MAEIHVVAAIIHHPDQQQVLLAKRPNDADQGGLWEFPGGKVAAGESPRQALARELAEELAIDIGSGADTEVAVTPISLGARQQAGNAHAFLTIRHCYPDKVVLLDIWQVWHFAGTPVGNEGQLIRWVDRRDLADYSFPAANQPVITALQGAG